MDAKQAQRELRKRVSNPSDGSGVVPAWVICRIRSDDAGINSLIKEQLNVDCKKKARGVNSHRR